MWEDGDFDYRRALAENFRSEETRLMARHSKITKRRRLWKMRMSADQKSITLSLNAGRKSGSPFSFLP
jgi:ribosomal protein L20